MNGEGSPASKAMRRKENKKSIEAGASVSDYDEEYESEEEDAAVRKIVLNSQANGKAQTDVTD